MNLAAIALASLLGSLHCAGMCGGIATVACAAGSRPARGLPSVAYHGARLVGYVALGSIAAVAGASIDAAWRLTLGAQNVMGILTAIMLLALAIRQLLPSTGSLVKLGRGPRRERISTLLARALGRRGLVGAAGVGLLTALLPCGWLWSFVVVAAGTADVPSASAIMAAMWLGTLPSLALVGVAGATATRVLGRHAPKLTAAILVVLAIFSVTHRLVPAPAADETFAERPSCH